MAEQDLSSPRQVARAKIRGNPMESSAAQKVLADLAQREAESWDLDNLIDFAAGKLFDALDGIEDEAQLEAALRDGYGYCFDAEDLEGDDEDEAQSAP